MMPCGICEGIRDEVLLFAHVMEEKLSQNDWQGGWQNCPVDWLLSRVWEEMRELEIAMQKPWNKATVVREAADVANFVMMIADVVGALEKRD